MNDFLRLILPPLIVIAILIVTGWLATRKAPDADRNDRPYEGGRGYPADGSDDDGIATR